MSNGSSYYSGFPFSQSEAMAGPGPSDASGGGGTFDSLAALSPAGAGAFGPGSPGGQLTPGAGYSEELFGFSLFDTYVGPITKLSNPLDASGWRAFAKVAGRNFLASRMAISIKNWGGTSIRLGLFDASGKLKARTAQFVGANGTVMVQPLEVSAQLMGSLPYYMGYWSNDTTGNLTFRCVSGRSISDESPLMQRNDLNENAVNLGAQNDMMTPLRPWLMVME